MNNENQERTKWLKDSEEYFKQVQAYNSTVITVGYATFFAALVFISTKTESKLVFWALLAVVFSASIFVAYEMVNQVKLALNASKAGEINRRQFRYWACFFVPSLLLGIAGLALLVVLILCQAWTGPTSS